MGSWKKRTLDVGLGLSRSCHLKQPDWIYAEAAKEPTYHYKHLREYHYNMMLYIFINHAVCPGPWQRANIRDLQLEGRQSYHKIWVDRENGGDRLVQPWQVMKKILEASNDVLPSIKILKLYICSKIDDFLQYAALFRKALPIFAESWIHMKEDLFQKQRHCRAFGSEPWRSCAEA